MRRGASSLAQLSWLSLAGGREICERGKENRCVPLSRRARRGWLGWNNFLPVPRPTLLAVGTNHDYLT